MFVRRRGIGHWCMPMLAADFPDVMLQPGVTAGKRGEVRIIELRRE